MSEQKPLLNRITDFFNSTSGLIVAVFTLISTLGAYGITHPDIIWPNSVPIATCIDGEKNGDEEDVDCGGTCKPCITPAAGGFGNLANMIVETSGRLTKTGGGNNWNAGASSRKHLPAGVAGGVTYTIKASDGHFLFGLSPSAGDAGYEQISYGLAIQPRNAQSVQLNVFESGINRTNSQPPVNTEVSIYRSADGKITYSIDGVAMTGIPPSQDRGRLLLDLSVKDGGVSGLRLVGGWKD